MRTVGVPGKGSLEVLSRLKTGPDAIHRASGRGAGSKRAMPGEPGLPEVSACNVHNGSLQRPNAPGIVYIAAPVCVRRDQEVGVWRAW
jgi:hypothetical protein